MWTVSDVAALMITITVCLIALYAAYKFINMMMK